MENRSIQQLVEQSYINNTYCLIYSFFTQDEFPQVLNEISKREQKETSQFGLYIGGDINYRLLSSMRWENLQILELQLDTAGVTETIAKSRWRNIKKITLSRRPFVKMESFQEVITSLVNGPWKNLQELKIRNIERETPNSIGKPWQMLSKNFKKMKSLSLPYNNFGTEGFRYFVQGQWPDLTQLNLNECMIASEECRYLSQAKWHKILKLNLSSNSIDKAGCKYLTYANWNSLSQIALNSNRLGSKGCKNLAQAQWPHLNKLSLNYNQIEETGCHYLSKAVWKSLRDLSLAGNRLNSESCKMLSKSDWKDLMCLCLNVNQLTVQGHTQLIKADYQLGVISLHRNQIHQLFLIILDEKWPDKLVFDDILL